jgi:hypothetical protein
MGEHGVRPLRPCTTLEHASRSTSVCLPPVFVRLTPATQGMNRNTGVSLSCELV